MEQGAGWYDTSFESHDHWKKHYTESRYHAMWCVVVDRLVCAGVQRVLDVGCGPGQLAQLALDRGIREYCGLDFSPKRIEFARTACPGARFEVADAYTTDLIASCEYDGVICTEFLEHVDGDLAIIDRLRSGVRFVGSVPNFPYKSHVRHFETADQVTDRYGTAFSGLRVDTLVANVAGRKYFVMDGLTCIKTA